MAGQSGQIRRFGGIHCRSRAKPLVAGPCLCKCHLARNQIAYHYSNARVLVVTPFDKSSLKDIERSPGSINLGITDNNDV